MTLLSGVPLVTLVLGLPGRFQILNNTSAFDSGIRILPLTLTIAVSSALAGGLTARGRVPPLVVFSAAAALQLVGLGLLYSVPTDSPLSARLYGYQTLIGIGVGISLATAILTVPSLVGENGMCKWPLLLPPR
jgi:Ca2+/H+ antiporter